MLDLGDHCLLARHIAWLLPVIYAIRQNSFGDPSACTFPWAPELTIMAVMKQIISAAVTPFTDADKLDLDSAAKVYEFGIEHAIDGFFILGTMGEWALVTPEEKVAVAEHACQVIGGRARVLVGVTDTGLPSILRNTERLRHLKHDAWVVVLPSGMAAPGDPVAYMHGLADACDRPLYLYYLPQMNRITLSIQQFRDILAHPGIAGVKNSAGHVRLRRDLLMLKQEVAFELYDGEEWGIDEALALGCDGAISGFGSTAAKLVKSIAASVDAGRLADAVGQQYRLIDIMHNVYGDGAKYWSAGQKCALKYMGIIASDRSRVPSQQPLPEPHRERVRRCIDANRDYLF